MRITQGEWAALKVAVSIAEDCRDALTKNQLAWLDRAVSAIAAADDRLTKDNRKQADLMKRKRASAEC